ncbi:hypothetical protein PCANC_21923 [Puccinia coronata f. sp. avenae]|uniref:Phosphatidylethanolamine-binding protein n=1 Tax=Puccinia coronata f. sp. avenae TaxID=200324 RepID=A0A2N5TSU1_9BASI|nr:hypothetical protein PCANC_21923 [Puccinia coronata f. sp. avenae]
MSGSNRSESGKNSFSVSKAFGTAAQVLDKSQPSGTTAENQPAMKMMLIYPINSTARVRVLQQPQQCVFASTAATAEVEQAESNDQVYRSQANKPLKPSVEKAFQESMKYLKQDAERLQSKLKDLQTSQEITRSPEEIERLAILSAVNDVQVRKNHKLGEQVDMSKPIYRFLEQQRWRKGGQLGRLMETIHRLRIFPDLFPSIDPSVDLQIKFQDNYLQDAHRSINIGNFVPSSKSTQLPVIQAQVFHPETRLYTLVMVDPDVPDPQNHSFTTFLHWVRTNISLSATTNGELDLRSEKEEEEVVKYVPPHPAQGSGIHRYTVMIFEQPGPVALSGHQDLLERAGFSLRRFSSQLDLKPAGVMAWISQWHQRDADTISAIYRDELQIPEPRYGKEPKPYSARIKLPSHTPLPLTHRHPPVIPWRQKMASSSADS